MIVIGIPDKADVDAGILILSRKINGSANWVRDGLDKGFYEGATVKLAGENRYLVVFHVTDQKTLNINAAAQLTSYSDLPALLESFVAIAKKKLCVGIEAVTVRAGICKKFFEAGYKPAGVHIYYEL
jgi:hypothetical protein